MATKSVRLPGLVEIKDPGASGQILVPDQHHMVCALTTAASETRTMAIPKFLGQVCTLTLTVDGGNCSVNIAGDANTLGHDTVLFTAVGQAITMTGAMLSGALRWRCPVVDPTSILS